MISIKSLVSSRCTILYEFSVLYYKWDNGINAILSACTSGKHSWGLEVVPVGSSVAVKEVYLNNVHYIRSREPTFFLCISTRFLFHICLLVVSLFNFFWQQTYFRITNCLLYSIYVVWYFWQENTWNLLWSELHDS